MKKHIIHIVLLACTVLTVNGQDLAREYYEPLKKKYETDGRGRFSELVFYSNIERETYGYYGLGWNLDAFRIRLLKTEKYSPVNFLKGINIKASFGVNVQMDYRLKTLERNEYLKVRLSQKLFSLKPNITGSLVIRNFHPMNIVLSYGYEYSLDFNQYKAKKTSLDWIFTGSPGYEKIKSKVKVNNHSAGFYPVLRAMLFFPTKRTGSSSFLIGVYQNNLFGEPVWNGFIGFGF